MATFKVMIFILVVALALGFSRYIQNHTINRMYWRIITLGLSAALAVSFIVAYPQIGQAQWELISFITFGLLAIYQGWRLKINPAWRSNKPLQIWLIFIIISSIISLILFLLYMLGYLH